jgi:predicted GNAT family acetyltransferase
MSDAFEFRDATSADASVVTRHRFGGELEPEDERLAFEAWVAERLAAGTYIGRLALSSGVVVAGAGIVLLDWGPTRGNLGGVCGRVVAVFTEPAMRRRGLASTLVRQVMALAEGRGVRDFRLAASAEGARMYQALGFRRYDAEMICKRGARALRGSSSDPEAVTG